MGWSFTIGRISGTEVRIHITFLIFIAWIWGASYIAEGPVAAWNSLFFILLLFLCVLLHEFGHIFAARGFGVETPDVTLLPIGGVARLAPHSGGALSGIADRACRSSRERGHRRPARGAVSCPSGAHALGRRREHPRAAGGPVDRGQPVPRRVQHDPGVSDGWRPGAARAARHQAWLCAGHEGGGQHRSGAGLCVWRGRAVYKSAADLYCHVRLFCRIRGNRMRQRCARCRKGCR